MDKFQIARHKADQRGLDFLNENDTALKVNILYSPLKIIYDDKMSAIEVARQKQFEQVTPITDYKNILRELLISTVYPFSSEACVQAAGLNKPDLAASLDHPVTFLSKASDSDLLGRANDLKTIMADNIGILTVLAPDDITAMETAITDFALAKDKPQEEIKDKKALGTDPIPGLLDDIDGIKNKISKLLLSAFPDLYPVWKSRIKVGSPDGVRNTSLVIRYYDASSDGFLENVKATLEDAVTNVVKTSTKKGYVRFYSLPTGTYILTSEHPSFITDIKTNIGVINTQIVRLDVRLSPRILSGILDLTVFDKLTGNPLSGVLLNIPSILFQDTTSSSGKLLKNELPAGTYEAFLTCNTYKRLDFTFTIETKQSTILQLYMEKEA